MSKTRTIGGHFSPEAVEVNYAVTTILSEWELKHLRTKIIGNRALTFRLQVPWCGRQGIACGMIEFPDMLQTVLAPNFSEVKVKMGREQQDKEDGCRWKVSLYISWSKRYTPTKFGTLTVRKKEETVWKDSAGKLFYTLDMASPSFFRNCYIERFKSKGFVESETYEKAVTADELAKQIFDAPQVRSEA